MRRTVFGICVMALLALVPVRLSAQPALVVVPESGIVQVDEEFDVDIVAAAGFADLMGYDISIAFNDSLIELIGVAEGALPQSAAAPTFFWWTAEAPDTVTVNGAVLGATVDGPGVLCTLTFKAIEVGTTPISVTHSDLRTGTNADISHTTQPATVIVDKTIPVERTTWGRLKGLYPGRE